MANKRRSLAEMLKEDQAETPKPAPVLEAVAKPEPVAKVIKTPEPVVQEVVPKAEKRFPKSDFVKMSVTVPPDMFEQLQDLSRTRRRAKEPYTMSDLVRDALVQWLPDPES